MICCLQESIKIAENYALGCGSSLAPNLGGSPHFIVVAIYGCILSRRTNPSLSKPYTPFRTDFHRPSNYALTGLNPVKWRWRESNPRPNDLIHRVIDSMLRKDWDSNPRRPSRTLTVFKTAAFNHSAISPIFRFCYSRQRLWTCYPLALQGSTPTYVPVASFSSEPSVTPAFRAHQITLQCI